VYNPAGVTEVKYDEYGTITLWVFAKQMLVKAKEVPHLSKAGSEVRMALAIHPELSRVHFY